MDTFSIVIGFIMQNAGVVVVVDYFFVNYLETFEGNSADQTWSSSRKMPGKKTEATIVVAANTV